MKIFSAIKETKFSFKGSFSKEALKVFEVIYENYYPKKDYESIPFKETIRLALYASDSGKEITTDDLILGSIVMIKVGDFIVVLENKTGLVLSAKHKDDRKEHKLLSQLRDEAGLKLHANAGLINYYTPQMPVDLTRENNFFNAKVIK